MTVAIRTDMAYRIIHRETANWVGMAASVAGGFVATQFNRNFSANPFDPSFIDGLLMVVPRSSGLANEGVPADVQWELNSLEEQIRIWTGINNEWAETLRGYLAIITQYASESMAN